MVNEQSFKRALYAYKDRFNRWKKNIKGTRFNKEQNVTIKFVVPLLNMLGWNPFTEDMEFEYYIRGRGKKGRNVDIALLPEIPKILVEVEPIQNKLKHGIRQIFKHYLRNSRSSFGIVTNGWQLNLYHKYKQRHHTVNLTPLFAFRTIDDIIDYRDVLWLLSKDMVKNGALNRFAIHWHNSNAGYFKWRKQRKTGNTELDNYILSLEFARDFLNRVDKRSK